MPETAACSANWSGQHSQPFVNLEVQILWQALLPLPRYHITTPPHYQPLPHHRTILPPPRHQPLPHYHTTIQTTTNTTTTLWATFFSENLSDAFWESFPHCLWSGVATKRKRKRTSAGGKGQKSRRRRRKRKRRKRGGRRKKRRRRRRRQRREEKEEKEKALPAALLQITIQYTPAM